MADSPNSQPLDEFARRAMSCDARADDLTKWVDDVRAAVASGIEVFDQLRARATAAGPLTGWRASAPDVLDDYRRWRCDAGRVLQALKRLKVAGVRLVVEEGRFVRAYLESGRVVADFDRAADLVSGRVRGPGVPLGEAVNGLRDRVVREGA
jgi:hypothetical protein